MKMLQEAVGEMEGDAEEEVREVHDESAESMRRAWSKFRKRFKKKKMFSHRPTTLFVPIINCLLLKISQLHGGG